MNRPSFSLTLTNGEFMTIKELERQILYHNNLYFNEEPKISDIKFDKLVLELRKRNPTSNILNVVGCTPSYGVKIKHDTPMGSINKTTTFKGYLKWYFPTFETVWSWKIDGCAIGLKYKSGILYKAVTRGDGYIGQDITDCIMQCEDIPKVLDKRQSCEIRGEAYIPKDFFEEYLSKLYKNERNAVSGILQSKDPMDCRGKKISFKGYRLLSINGESLYKWLTTERKVLKLCGIGSVKQHSGGFTKKLIKKLTNKRNKLNYKTDGIVISINNNKSRNSRGVVGLNCKGQIAYKFPPETKNTMLLGVALQVGRTGQIAPIAILEPIHIDGSLVSRPSLANFSKIRELDLHINDIVTVSKRGDIIPKIEAVHEKAVNGITISTPTNCPDCKSELQLVNHDLFCTNLNCFSRLANSIVHFIQSTGVKGIGEATIYSLVESGFVKRVEDIFDVTKEQLLSLDNWGDLKVDNYYNTLNQMQDIELWRFICGLGIKETGESTSKLLANHYKTLENFLGATGDELTAMDGIGHITADGIIKYLSGTYLSGLLEKVTVKSVKEIAGTLCGKSFACTGKVSKPRKEIEKLVVDNGGNFTGINKNLNYLIIGDGAVPAKINKAQANGSIILTEDEFTVMIND